MKSTDRQPRDKRPDCELSRELRTYWSDQLNRHDRVVGYYSLGKESGVKRRESALAKRILRKHGYPPDRWKRPTQTVLEQTALLSAEWATARWAARQSAETGGAREV